MLNKIESFSEFIHKVGMLNLSHFDSIPIKPNSAGGAFDFYRLPELERFCTKNSEYHIISQISPSIYINTIVFDAGTYFLANGDKDPNLILVPRLGWEEYVNFLIFKFWSGKSLAE